MSHGQSRQCGDQQPGFHSPSGLWQGLGSGQDGRAGQIPTILSVEADFSTVLLMALQSLVQPLQGWLTGLWDHRGSGSCRFSA